MRGRRTETHNPQLPFLNIPAASPTAKSFRLPKKAVVQEFYAIANGKQRVFTECHAVPELGKTLILDPSQVSYMNLFINAVLQPHESYCVTKGKLELLTCDVPAKGTPVILQMIKL